MAILNFLFTTVYKVSGNTYYYRIVEKDSGDIWDENAGAMAASPLWANSKVAMPETGSTGQFDITIPTGLPTGKNYDLVVYLQATGSPLVTDARDVGLDLRWGSIFGF